MSRSSPRGGFFFPRPSRGRSSSGARRCTTLFTYRGEQFVRCAMCLNFTPVRYNSTRNPSASSLEIVLSFGSASLRRAD